MARVGTYGGRADPDELSLELSGEEFRFWLRPSLTLSLDTYSTLGFGAPFESGREAFRNTFRPYRYRDARVLLAGETLFTGRLMHVLPQVDETSRTVEISGWARPGALNVHPPADRVPLEFKGVGLRTIATVVADWFGLEVEFEGDEGPVFDKIALEPTEQCQSFLVGLAKQRGFVINDTPEGKLRFWRSVSAGNPVARLAGGESPLCRVTPQFSPESCYSEITAFAPAKNGRAGARYTVKNPWLDGVALRPFNFEISDTDPADAPAAAQAKLGRMFAEIASYEVSNLPTWRDLRGNFWQPNTTIVLTAPDAMIYTPTEFLIRDVTLTREPDRKTAALQLVMLGAFSGEAPESLPWI